MTEVAIRKVSICGLLAQKRSDIRCTCDHGIARAFGTTSRLRVQLYTWNPCAAFIPLSTGALKPYYIDTTKAGLTDRSIFRSCT